MTGTRTLGRNVIAALALVGASAMAQQQRSPLEGTWRIEGARPGTVLITRAGGGPLILSTWYDDGTRRPDATEDRGRRGTFNLPRGANSVLQGLIGRPDTITAARQGQNLALTQRQGGQVVAQEQLRPYRAALLVPVLPYNEPEQKAFTTYANRLARHYKQSGFDRADVAPVTSLQQITGALKAAAREVRPYSRLVFIGHGGWDGPMFRTGQISGQQGEEGFEQLAAAIKVGTTPDAKIFASSCHSAGSSVGELEQGMSTYRWTDDLARRTGRVVAGPLGKTSTEWTYQHVLAALEGQGTTMQGVRISSPAGFQVLRPRTGLADSQVQPWPVDTGQVTQLPRPRPADPVPAGARRIDLPLGAPPGNGSGEREAPARSAPDE